MFWIFILRCLKRVWWFVFVLMVYYMKCCVWGVNWFCCWYCVLRWWCGWILLKSVYCRMVVLCCCWVVGWLMCVFLLCYLSGVSVWCCDCWIKIRFVWCWSVWGLVSNWLCSCVSCYINCMVFFWWWGWWVLVKVLCCMLDCRSWIIICVIFLWLKILLNIWLKGLVRCRLIFVLVWFLFVGCVWFCVRIWMWWWLVKFVILKL